jgi:hypothetical protein
MLGATTAPTTSTSGSMSSSPDPGVWRRTVHVRSEAEQSGAFILGRLWARAPARRPDRGSYDRQKLWWDSGCRFDADVRVPVEVSLQPFNANSPEESPALPAFIDGVVPLMRLDLIEALRAAGVSNLDLYDAVLIDPDTGARHTDYRAFNLIGAVAAADLAASQLQGADGAALINVSFDRLVLNAGLSAGLLMFRLAENNAAIVVHGSVKQALLAAGFDELEFFKPENIAL